MSNYVQQSDGVWFKPSPALDIQDVHFVISQCANTATKRARLCLHSSPLSGFHAMLIGLHHSTVVPMHRHLGRDESLTWVRGECAVELFDADKQGFVSRNLGTDHFCVLVAANTWHAVTVQSNTAVLLECTTGPWRPEDTEYL